MTDKIELLAPAGTWDVLEKVAVAGADAVYIGDKRFNMRLLKSSHNFTDSEIKNAVHFLHKQNKKLYITVNNLYFEKETEEIKEYLLFLEDIGVDALIVQDLSIASLYKELNLTIPLLASVQMGIGNSEAANFLKENGFSRVILSQNISLNEIREIKKHTIMGIEVFAHGDLCISHTGQCHMSSFIAGVSSNRGICIKPCRWQYKLGFDGTPGYHLAHNDLSLYPYITNLIDAGVGSLKIEGRMRSAEYLSSIISLYRRAIDRIVQEQDDYQVDLDELNRLEDIKVRNYSVGRLWGELGLDNVDISGENEPFFPTKAKQLKKLTIDDYFEEKNDINSNDIDLAVKLGSLQALEAIKNDCQTIIIGLEKFPFYNLGFNRDDIRDILGWAKGNNTKIKIETPRIVTQSNWRKIEELGSMEKSENLSGFIVNDLGSFRYFSSQGFKVWGGPGLNIANSRSNNFLINRGMSGVCLSPELKLKNIKEIGDSGRNLEMFVHGPLCGMITDYPITEIRGEDSKSNLIDKYGQIYRLRKADDGRTNIYFPYDLCLFNYLPKLLAMNISRMRIDGQFYKTDTLIKVVRIYNQSIKDIQKGSQLTSDSFAAILDLFDEGLTDLSFGKPK